MPRVDDAGWVRIHAALDAGDPTGEVRDFWVAKERVRDVYGTDDPEQAASRLDAAIAWCTEAESGPELRRLAKMLRRWMTQILAHHRTGASNGPVEAMNLLIKQVKRSNRGFRSFENYRLRILLAGSRRQRARLTPSRVSVLAVPGWSRRARKGYLAGRLTPHRRSHPVDDYRRTRLVRLPRGYRRRRPLPQGSGRRSRTA